MSTLLQTSAPNHRHPRDNRTHPLSTLAGLLGVGRRRSTPALPSRRHKLNKHTLHVWRIYAHAFEIPHERFSPQRHETHYITYGHSTRDKRVAAVDRTVYILHSIATTQPSRHRLRHLRHLRGLPLLPLMLREIGALRRPASEGGWLMESVFEVLHTPPTSRTLARETPNTIDDRCVSDA